MKKYFLVVVAFVMLVITSCQKEIDWGTSNNQSSSGDLLVKSVSKSGTDSVITLYTYNAARKIMKEKITGISGGIDASNEFRYYRNTSNIITHYTQINPNLSAVGIDSVVTQVNYNSTSGRYTSTVSEISLMGFSVRDSTVLVYGANGKVTNTDLYQSIPLISPVYEISLRVKYTYDAAGNLTQQDFFSVDPLTLVEDPVSIIKYTYDTKTAAIKFDNESFVMGKADNVSVNNATKVEFIDINTPSNGFINSNVFTYNSSNRPGTAVSTRTPGSVVNNITFFYK